MKEFFAKARKVLELCIFQSRILGIKKDKCNILDIPLFIHKLVSEYKFYITINEQI